MLLLVLKDSLLKFVVPLPHRVRNFLTLSPYDSSYFNKRRVVFKVGMSVEALLKLAFFNFKYPFAKKPRNKILLKINTDLLDDIVEIG